MDKYDFDKIMGSGDQAYVTTYGDTLEKHNIELENENTKIKDENRRVVQENNALLQNAESDRAEIFRFRKFLQSSARRAIPPPEPRPRLQ